jgi:hypothetical protein
LFFTKAKKGTPFVIKALSTNFESTLDFGLVRETEESLAKKYKVKFPGMVVIKSEGKPIVYDKDDFTYKQLFEFLNVHSQIFVDPSASKATPKQNAAAKPWLTVSVPQITKDSGNDVCLKKDGTLCVVFIAKESSQADQSILDTLNSVSQGFASKISRGISFSVSWVDASREPEFVSTFGIEESSLPSLIVLNPGKRKRFLLHEGEITESAIE